MERGREVEMSRARVLGACFGALAVLIGMVAPVGAVSSASSTVAGRATDWTASKQQADGSFEVAGFPGFETPDAVLALAEQAQTGTSWSTSEALARIQGLQTGGKSALDALDDYADSTTSPISAGAAAKLIVLDVLPLGLDPTAFDPQGDGATDLVAKLNAGKLADGSYGAGALNATDYAVLALRLLGDPVGSETLTYLRGAQQANGGWDFSAASGGSGADIDTTGLTVEALIAEGVSPSDPAITKALTFLATQQNADGSWSAFGSPDPNSTSLGLLALVAAGADPSSACWRDSRVAAKVGAAYVDPSASLRSLQASDGHITSPNDSFGVNTFATAQTVEALLGRWLPVAPAAAEKCTEPAAPTTTTTAATTAATTATTTPAKSTTTTAAPTIAVAGEQVSTSTTSAAAATGATIKGTLPRTGDSNRPLVELGIGAIALGLALAVGARRARRVAG